MKPLRTPFRGPTNCGHCQDPLPDEYTYLHHYVPDMAGGGYCFKRYGVRTFAEAYRKVWGVDPDDDEPKPKRPARMWDYKGIRYTEDTCPICRSDHSIRPLDPHVAVVAVVNHRDLTLYDNGNDEYVRGCAFCLEKAAEELQKQAAILRQVRMGGKKVE